MVRIVIIGSGVIGRQWALIYASGGHEVQLYDVDANQVAVALHAVRAQLCQLERDGSLRGELTAAQQSLLINGSGSLVECLAGASLVQECIPEDLALKQRLFQQLDGLVTDDDVALCSSSSCLPISQIAQGLPRAAQCLVAHPINPPYFLPLVELVPGPACRPELLLRVRQLLLSCGQQPVLLHREVAGFAVNRIQYAIINECWSLVQDGVMSAADVDKVMQFGLGPRYAFYGPFAVMHLNADGLEDYCARYGAGMRSVSAQLGAPPSYEEQPTLSLVSEAMTNAVPLLEVGAARRRREQRLAKFNKFMSQMLSEEAEEDALVSEQA